MENKAITCYGCGAPVAVDSKKCESCGNPVNITTFSSLEGLSPPQINKYIGSYQRDDSDPQGQATALAFCFIRLKLYDKAEAQFDKAMEDNYSNSEVFFYAAVCQLKGKKAFMAPRAAIDKALEYLNAGIMTEPRAIYRYFLAYIKYDFFRRKGFKIEPDFFEEFNTSREMGLASGDVDHLYKVLSVQPVDDLAV